MAFLRDNDKLSHSEFRLFNSDEHLKEPKFSEAYDR